MKYNTSSDEKLFDIAVKMEHSALIVLRNKQKEAYEEFDNFEY